MINVAGGKRTSLNTLVERLVSITGARVEPEHGDPRPGDVRDSLADLSKARSLLGYAPKVTIEEGLERTVAHLRSKAPRKTSLRSSHQSVAGDSFRQSTAS